MKSKGKRICLTGHTAGLGAGLTDAFLTDGHQVLGLSRSQAPERSGLTQSTCDINNVSLAVEKILSYDADLFVNNAESGFSQVEIARLLAKNWSDKNKIIINISSNASDFSLREPEIFATANYDLAKSALDRQSQKMQFAFPALKTINLRPGLFDSKRGQKFSGAKMSVEQVVQIVRTILHLCESGVYIQECTFSHVDQFKS